ncbi:lytic transglycosylase domain-containing protein [Edwardsiella piscicida]|uniref:lytic transglycosylase domain-containing protein n=1 Tax=Edwardsiella piscicida TaxID=1263550 RepID=UPI000D511C47|nr:lytic transglycosylase domain-containing protein [Edwardsiella piscicida]UCQ36385.1 lytic transglycosylase domain-containing protein [Edwardsiella piscicida]
MIIQELAYKVKIQAEEFLAGKKKVAQSVAELDQDVKKPLESVGKRFDGLTDGVTAFGNAGKNAFNQVQMGAAKFLGVALTLEGARRLFTSTTRNLVDLGNTSSFLDMGAKSLDGFNRAAAATGASEQSMTSMLMRLKNAQNWMAMPMGAPDASTIAIQQLQGMTGVDIMGEKDPGKMLLRSATALRKLNKAQAEVMWGQMGGAPDMFGLVYSGKLPAMQKEFEKRSNATDPAIKRANEVNETLEKLRQTVDNLGNDFVLAFGDDVNKLLQQFGDWITNNKDNILGFFREGSEVAKKFADSVGGITNALIILAGMRAGPAGIAVAGGYVLGDLTTPESQKNLPNDQRNWLFKERDFGKVGGWLKDAAEWGDENLNPMTKLKSLLRYTGAISDANASEIKPNMSHEAVIASIAMAESGGNPNAISKAGAAGLMQLMPGTAADYGLSPSERFDPQKSMMVGTMHFNRLLRKYKGNYQDALRAYNWGEGNMDKWISGGRSGAMPKETMDYPGRVMSYYSQLSSMASRPSGTMGSVDNSQKSHISIQKVEVNSNPQTVSQLTTSIENQANRSRMNISFSSGNN